MRLRVIALYQALAVLPLHVLGVGHAQPRPDSTTTVRVVLTPVQGEMICYAEFATFPDQRFALGVPETIGCREEMMLLNFPDVKGQLKWSGPDSVGVVSTGWIREGVLTYQLELVPGSDYVDLKMTVENLSEKPWSDVFSFNCLNPVRAPMFKDWKHERTYFSHDGHPTPLAEIRRNPGRRPTAGIYLPETVRDGNEPPFAAALGGISPDRTDGDWLVSLSEPPGGYVATASSPALFLFTNQDRCCIHSAAYFGHIAPGGLQSTVSRFYFARGGLADFLKRIEQD